MFLKCSQKNSNTEKQIQWCFETGKSNTMNIKEKSNNNKEKEDIDYPFLEDEDSMNIRNPMGYLFTDITRRSFCMSDSEKMENIENHDTVRENNINRRIIIGNDSINNIDKNNTEETKNSKIKPVVKKSSEKLSEEIPKFTSAYTNSLKSINSEIDNNGTIKKLSSPVNNNNNNSNSNSNSNSNNNNNNKTSNNHHNHNHHLHLHFTRHHHHQNDNTKNLRLNTNNLINGKSPVIKSDGPVISPIIDIDTYLDKYTQDKSTQDKYTQDHIPSPSTITPPPQYSPSNSPKSTISNNYNNKPSSSPLNNISPSPAPISPLSPLPSSKPSSIPQTQPPPRRTVSPHHKTQNMSYSSSSNYSETSNYTSSSSHTPSYINVKRSATCIRKPFNNFNFLKYANPSQLYRSKSVSDKDFVPYIPNSPTSPINSDQESTSTSTQSNSQINLEKDKKVIYYDNNIFMNNKIKNSNLINIDQDKPIFNNENDNNKRELNSSVTPILGNNVNGNNQLVLSSKNNNKLFNSKSSLSLSTFPNSPKIDNSRSPTIPRSNSLSKTKRVNLYFNHNKEYENSVISEASSLSKCLTPLLSNNSSIKTPTGISNKNCNEINGRKNSAPFIKASTLVNNQFKNSPIKPGTPSMHSVAVSKRSYSESYVSLYIFILKILNIL